MFKTKINVYWKQTSKFATKTIIAILLFQFILPFNLIPQAQATDFTSSTEAYQATPASLTNTLADYQTTAFTAGNYTSVGVDDTSYMTTTAMNVSACGSATMSDIDGNSYNIITIGSQCWMQDNLRTSRYADGTSITRGPATATWASGDLGYYAYPPNTSNTAEETIANINANKLGFVYQWSAAMHGSTIEGTQGVCPTGWHLPTDQEIKTLEGAVDSIYGVGNAIWDNTGGRGNDVGTKLKTISSTTFSSPLAGFRSNGFYDRGSYAYLWSSTPNASNTAWNRSLYSGSALSTRYNIYSKANAFSVRCVKNSVILTPSYASQLYTFNPTSFTNYGRIDISLIANGTASAGNGINAKIWNKTTSQWIGLYSLTNTSSTMPSSLATQSLTTNVSDYVDVNNKIRILVNTINPSASGTNAVLNTDYIKIGVWGAPSVTTNTVSSITSTTATGNGNLTFTGGENPTRYIEWGTSSGSYPNSCNAWIGSTGTYTCSITGLSPNTTYYYRAKATNSSWTAYGSELNFITSAAAPTVTTNSTTSIGTTTATGNGNITSTGGLNPTRYIEWGTTSGSYPNSCNASTGGTGTYTCSITGLSPNTKYYYRAKAINSWGTAYGSELNFTTSAAAPTVTSNIVSNIGTTTATGNGNITYTGGLNPTRYIEWWTSSGSYPNSCNASTGGTGTYTCSMTGLIPNTTYYYRAKAINSGGTAYGSELNFITSAATPSVSTNSITEITNSTATGNGNVTNTNGENPERFIEWGITSGIYSFSCSAEIGGTGAFSCSMTNLNSNTTYYYRAKATNSGWTSYGSEMSFTTALGTPVNPIINNFNDGGLTTDTTPTFNFDLSDPDTGDLIKYQIQIDNNSDFSSPEIDFTEANYTVTPRTGTEYTASGLTNGQWFWRVKVIDDDGLQSDWSTASSGFTIDTILPVSTIKYPENNNKHLKDVPRIIGIATDGNGSGIASTFISIKDNVTGLYYTGTDFTAETETWLTATGTSSWYYIAPDWTDMHSYTIRSRANDNAWNQEHTDSATFTYDTVNGLEGSIYVSDPAYMNNSDYEIYYPTSVAIPNGGQIQIDLPDEYAFSPWLEDNDIEITSTGIGEITSSVDVIDRLNKKITTTITGAGIGEGSLITIKINNLRIHNPGTEGDYNIAIGTYGVEGIVNLESGTGRVTIVKPYQQVELNVNIEQALQLSVDSGSVLLNVDPDVQLGQNWVGTGGAVSEKTEVEVKTNADGGYNLLISLSGNTATGSAVLDGQTLTGSQITSTDWDRVSTENNFTFGLNTGTAAIVTGFTNSATTVSGAGLNTATNSYSDDIYYYLNVDYTTPADTYMGTVTYTAVGEF